MSQSVPAELTEIHYDPDCSQEQIDEVLLALDRWSDRTAKHVTHRRASPRHDYRATVIAEPAEGDAADSSPRQLFHVPTRNVSKTGLGMIVPPIFMPRLLSDGTPIVRAESAFQVGTKIKLTLGAAVEANTTLRGEIVRVRPIHFGFFEIGVRFRDRELPVADVDGPASASNGE